MLNNTIQNLKKEINETLLFFVECDIKAYGFITRGTEEAFKTQKVAIPDALNEFRGQKNELSDKGLEIQNNLKHYTGCERPFKHPLHKDLLYTDGVQYLIKEARAYWLLDMIASHLKTIKQKAFTSINLEVYHLSNGRTKAIFKLDDGNDNVYQRELIEYTDFPLNEIRFFYTNDILILPSEY